MGMVHIDFNIINIIESHIYNKTLNVMSHLYIMNLEKLIYHLNEHSNYYKFRYYWSKIEMLIPNRSKYQFVASRANKRELAQIIKNNERDYQTI